MTWEHAADQRSRQTSFLPDFCRTENLLRTIVIAQLLAFVLVAARPVTGTDLLFDLGLLSLAIQWVALADVALLCALRDQLARLDKRVAAILAFALLQLVTVVFTLAVHHATGMFGLALHSASVLVGVLENLVISSIVSAVGLRYFYVTAQWQDNVRAEAEARVQALQARIRPHFLFNSMNTIASLARTNPAAAESAVEDLAEVFRGSMGETTHFTLARELELIASYLRIEQQRLGDRLRVEWSIDPLCRTAELPALSLQPLVENAIYHGVEQLPDGGTIRISAVREAGVVRIGIDNPTAASRTLSTGQQMAQENVRQRLELAFGEQARLQIHHDNDNYQVRLIVPAGE